MSRNQNNSCPIGCKVYVGGLTRNASREEVERAFGHYGKLSNVFVARNEQRFELILSKELLNTNPQLIGVC